ncbi:MAG: hypothetical protein U9P14_11830, partial [Gemmatimonadota bacterium]|nr:hypothetical protein [Gemmatimonadota bacterium]
MKNTVIVCGVLAVLVALGLAGAVAGDKEPAEVNASIPMGNQGLAARYPGDEGIENDSAVVFRETFEEGLVDDLGDRWTSISNKDGQVLVLMSDSSSPATFGKRSLRMTATKGYDTGGHLWKLLEPGYDQLYARFYVKFAEDHPYVHHFVHMGARINSPPYPMGGAGIRPNGNVNFSTGIELGSRSESDPPGAWFFY